MMNISKIIRSRSITSTFVPPITQFCTADKIEIPNRIHRGPTDILRALESTIKRDPTAAHYKYHDDPYLIPLSSSGKRMFAMAQESGRKAAHWVRKEHADLFQHREADPMIESFMPPIVYNEESQVERIDLDKLLALGHVEDATIVYKILKDKGLVDQEAELGILELLCYRNGRDEISTEFIEEKWYRKGSVKKDIIKKTWKDGDLADKIFQDMEPKTAAAYAAIIQGMAKYGQVEKAFHLFDESQKANLILNTNTYNALIASVNIAKENSELRWKLITEMLQSMKQQKLKPNLGTLNAVLYSLTYLGRQQITKGYTLKTLAEFKNLGIEPCLASWYYVLLTFCKERGPTSHILNDILNLVENKNHEIRDAKDVNFFVAAMEMCLRHLNDVNLAMRVDKLLHFGDNYNLIGDSFKESVYYRFYFLLLCANLPLDEFMNNFYLKLVPHVYVPEMAVMIEILKQVDANGAVEYAAKLWSDIVVFDYANREDVINIILNVMVDNQQLINKELGEKFANIAWDIYTRSLPEEGSVRVHRLKLTGDFLGKFLMLLCRNKNFDKACTIMNKLDKEQQKIPGVPRIEALSLFIDLCIEEKAPSRAIDCIQYCTDCGFPESKSLAQHLHEKLNLDEIFLGRLRNIVGDMS